MLKAKRGNHARRLCAELHDLRGQSPLNTLVQALGGQDATIWDSGNTAAWQQGLVNSQYTYLGTQYANGVVNGQVKYHCGISADCYGGDFAKRFQQGRQQFIGYVGPYHIQVRTDVKTGQPIGYLAYNTQTRRTITMKPQEVAGFYNLVSSGKTELVKRFKGSEPFKHGNLSARLVVSTAT